MRSAPCASPQSPIPNPQSEIPNQTGRVQMLHLPSNGEIYCTVSLATTKPVHRHNIGRTALKLGKETVPHTLFEAIFLDTPMQEKAHRSSAVEIRYPVTVLTAEGHLQGETRLINNRGALIRCQRPPDLYERATISIDISEKETLIVEAEVVRLEFYELDDNQEIAPRGMVVRFTKLSKVGRQRLRNVIASHYVKKVKRLSAEH